MGTEINIGGGLLSMLTVLFVALKLLNKIEWSWWWVLAPTWIPPAILFEVVQESQTMIILKNGSEIHCLPGNNPDTIRGFSPTVNNYWSFISCINFDYIGGFKLIFAQERQAKEDERKR